MSPRNWPRLARYVRQRRDELGLTQEEVAARGGPSTATIRLIETAAQSAYRAKSLRQLAEALGWTPDSPLAILNDREPQAAGAAEPHPMPSGRFQVTPGAGSGRFTGSRERDATPAAGLSMGPIVQWVREDIIRALARAGIRGRDIFPDEPDVAELWDATNLLSEDERVQAVSALRRIHLEEEPGNPGHHARPRRAG